MVGTRSQKQQPAAALATAVTTDINPSENQAKASDSMITAQQSKPTKAKHSKGTSKKAVWSSSDDAILVQTLLAQRAAGNLS